MGHWSTIIVDEKRYSYLIGQSHLKVRGLPEVDFSTLTGISWHEIKRGKHKRWFSITPKDVRRYIKEKICKKCILEEEQKRQKEDEERRRQQEQRQREIDNTNQMITTNFIIFNMMP